MDELNEDGVFTSHATPSNGPLIVVQTDMNAMAQDGIDVMGGPRPMRRTTYRAPSPFGGGFGQAPAAFGQASPAFGQAPAAFGQPMSFHRSPMASQQPSQPSQASHGPIAPTAQIFVTKME
jgi:hypothetical protein